jgi:hypothetical protein
MLELELKDTRLTKRYKLVKRLAELPTPRLTPLPVPSSSDSYLKASTKPSPRHLNYNSKPNNASTPRSFASDLCTGNKSSGGIRSLSTGEALLRSCNRLGALPVKLILRNFPTCTKRYAREYLS